MTFRLSRYFRLSDSLAARQGGGYSSVLTGADGEISQTILTREVWIGGPKWSIAFSVEVLDGDGFIRRSGYGSCCQSNSPGAEDRPNSGYKRLSIERLG
jgi:hypothetical protein